MPMMKIRRFLRRIAIIYALVRFFREIKRLVSEWIGVFILKPRYDRLFLRLISLKKDKIRVLFPLSNISKWKVQSLYDLMAKSDRYEPIVAITLMDIERHLAPSDAKRHIEDIKEFLNKHKCSFVVAYDCGKNKFIPFSEFKPDIVWYTQPWYIEKSQAPLQVSKYALTCHTPYYLQNYDCLDMECDIFFMRSLWRNFAMNEAWADVCNKYQGKRRTTESIGLGHPMLDQFLNVQEREEDRKYIIYAPHWSCNTGECFSTFLENGKNMLAFAKAHKELDWVFKPHPTLRYTLINTVGWSEEEVDKYYSEWENLGTACYTSDYIDLFNKSKVMITDCASFLVEYSCTKMPIIHLVSANSRYKVHQIAQKMFSLYYQAHKWEEFVEHFNKVVVEGNDYKREDRIEEVRKMRLLDSNAAENIIQYLDSIFVK